VTNSDQPFQFSLRGALLAFLWVAIVLAALRSGTLAMGVVLAPLAAHLGVMCWITTQPGPSSDARTTVTQAGWFLYGPWVGLVMTYATGVVLFFLAGAVVALLAFLVVLRKTHEAYDRGSSEKTYLLVSSWNMFGSHLVFYVWLVRLILDAYASV
jgi:hypothetical protein